MDSFPDKNTLLSIEQQEKEVLYEEWKSLYLIAIPFLYIFGLYVFLKKAFFKFIGKNVEINLWFVDGISINSRRVKEGSARWPSLDTVYNFKKGEGSNWVTRAIDNLWLHVRNAQAVRNRLKVVRHELADTIKAVHEKNPDKTVNILSLAAGAAQGVIEVVADLTRQGVDIKVLLVDHDETALEHAKTLALKHGIPDLVKTEKENVNYFNRALNGFAPDIIEMCGLMDYLREKLAVMLIRKILKNLPNEGFFLTCHIHHNHEAFFLEHVMEWWMIYRTKDEFEDLLVDGGFLDPRFNTEPLNIHSVAVMQRQDT